MENLNKIFMRGFDLLFAILFLLVFSPVYILASVIIMIVSPGSPIYKAERVGKDGKVFTLYKFRSMRIDSGKVRLTTLRNDERVFAFGRFIRKVKIDEMPQAVNILLGDMSVVGPRPEDRENAEKIYVGEYKKILNIKPGLTSPASLYDFTHGEKYETTEAYEEEFLPKKLDLELYYVENQSFWYNIALILKTAGIIIKMFFGKSDFKEPKELEAIKQKIKVPVGGNEK